MDKKEKDWKNLKNLVVDRDKTGEWTLEGCIDEEGMNTLISFIEAREDRAREERTEKILEELFNLIDGEEGRYLEVTTAKTIQDMIINKLTI